MESSPQVVHRQDQQDQNEQQDQNDLQDRRNPEGGQDGTPAREMAALWGEYLNRSDVGPDDDFFALGGNSLTGIKIIDRVAQEYGVQLSVRDFYLAQTPARVAELIEQGRAAA
ncbi:acyl carrier protein [Streptomyces sp. NPDC006285]|uniref:acyl carrier protein n=1 Tax=Streptomyces sp. NPDC006285 TaxID=3364742 RepID=UPI0036B9DE11